MSNVHVGDPAHLYKLDVFVKKLHIIILHGRILPSTEQLGDGT